MSDTTNTSDNKFKIDFSKLTFKNAMIALLCFSVFFASLGVYNFSQPNKISVDFEGADFSDAVWDTLNMNKTALNEALQIHVNSSWSMLGKAYDFMIEKVNTAYVLSRGNDSVMLTPWSTNATYILGQGNSNASSVGGTLYAKTADYGGATIAVADNVHLIISKGAGNITESVAASADCLITDWNTGYIRYYVSGSLYAYTDYYTGATNLSGWSLTWNTTVETIVDAYTAMAWKGGWNATVTDIIGNTLINWDMITDANTTVNALIAGASISWSQITSANTTVEEIVEAYTTMAWKSGWNATVQDIVNVILVDWAWDNDWNVTVNDLISNSAILWGQITNANTTVEEIVDAFTSMNWKGTWNATIIDIINRNQLTSLDTLEILINGVNRTDAVANPFVQCSYICDLSGSVYRMKNGTTGQIDYQTTDLNSLETSAIGNSTSGIVFLKELEFDYTVTVAENVIVMELLNGHLRSFINVANSTGSPYTISTDAIQAGFYLAQDSQLRYINSWTSTVADTVIENAMNGLTLGRTWKETVKVLGSFLLTDEISIPSYVSLDLSDATLKTANSTSINILQNSGDVEIEVVGGNLDGNKANNPVGGNPDLQNGIRFVSITSLRLENVNVTNCPYDGVYLNSISVFSSDKIIISGSGRYGFVSYDCYNGTYSDFDVSGGNNTGFATSGGSVLKLISGFSHNNNGHGFGFLTSQNMTVVACDSSGNTGTSDGFFIAGCDNAVLDSTCSAAKNGRNGVSLEECQNCIVEGIYNSNVDCGVALYENGPVVVQTCRYNTISVTTNGNGGDGINLNPSAYNFVIGNYLMLNADYGIHELGASDYNFFTSNYYLSNTNGTIVLAGANSNSTNNFAP